MKLLFLSSFIIICCLFIRKTPSINAKKPHYTSEGFRNPRLHKNFGWRDLPQAIWELLQVNTKKEPQPVFPTSVQFLQNNHTQTTLTWIGHSTFLIQHNGFNLITDPHFSERASPLSWVGPKRVTPLPMTIDQLPRIDFILISHNHYDHLDKKTLQELFDKQKNEQPYIFVPLKLKRWVEKIGFAKVKEVDWWEIIRIKDWEFTAVPTQHYSGRSLFDKNTTLWCGWVSKTNNFSYYFSSDTGYTEDFKEIGQRFGPFEIATINIGAYGPEWASKGVHLNPEQAVQVHKDIGSKLSVAAHWGTFILSFENIDEPPERLKKALMQQEVDPKTFIILKHGETLNF